MLGNFLRTFELDDAELDEKLPWNELLSATIFALWSTVRTTLGASLGQPIYGRDMILPMKYNTDRALITQKKQKRIDQSK